MAKHDDADDKSGGPRRDVALIHAVHEDGSLGVLRQRGERLELGAVRPLREGVPITGEIVRLTPRKELPIVCDVVTEVEAPAPRPGAAEQGGLVHKGPPRVATDRYRANWDAIWNRSNGGDGTVN